MRQLIIKYSILLIVTTIIARLLTGIIMMTWPDILIKENIDGSTTTYSYGLIERAFEYLINIVFIVLIKKELDKQKIKSVPLLIVTFFSSFIGVVFFLLISAQNKLNFNRQML